MKLTKKEIAEGRRLIRKHLIEDPDATYSEILLNLIEQDHPYLRVILERDENEK